MKRVSSRDVAKRAGVSQPTVSRVLSGSAGVHPATRDKVLTAASALGYSVNPVGRLLQGARPVQVAVVIDAHDDQLIDVLDQLAAWLRLTGVRLETYCAPGENVSRVAGELAAAGYDRVISRTAST